ncbi:MAG: hypothetical protein PHN90_09110, partial [Methanothrix sp.]|nr:hypothetical protein [Methanothrix sp.]
IILPRAQKYLDELGEDDIKKIGSGIEELKKNPYRSRPLVDIKKLRGFRSPPMYRLRVGRHRLRYFGIGCGIISLRRPKERYT